VRQVRGKQGQFSPHHFQGDTKGKSMQTIILWTGALAIIAMCIFPPWTQDQVGEQRSTLDLGYYFILRPPSETSLRVERLDTCLGLPDDYAARKAKYGAEYMTRLFQEEMNNRYDVVRVNSVLLSIQCAIVALLTGCLFWTFGKGKKNRASDLESVAK
jgi:hypothetical protein